MNDVPAPISLAEQHAAVMIDEIDLLLRKGKRTYAVLEVRD